MIWVVIVCCLLVLAAIIGFGFCIKKWQKSMIVEIGEVVEDKITNVSNIPQVVIDNYVEEIVASVKSEIKDIKISKKMSEKIAEDIKIAILEKLGENLNIEALDQRYLKSEEGEK